MKTFEEWKGGCPACGEDLDLNYSSINIDSFSADQRCLCFNCGLSWWEVYRLVGYEYTTYQGEQVFVGRASDLTHVSERGERSYEYDRDDKQD